MDPIQDTLIKAINEIILTLLGLVLTVIIPYGLMLFRAWAKAKIDAIQNGEVRKGFDDALTRLDQTATTVVAEINQTIKQRAADGKLIDPEKLKALAYKRIETRLPPEARTTLKTAYGEALPKVVVGKIEQKVLEGKRAEPCTPGAA